MTSDLPSIADPDYAAFLAALKGRIETARVRVAVAVNQQLVELYWSIGREILSRQASHGWGARVIDRLAEDLRRAYPDMKGFSRRNLNYMRAFAEAWPELETVQQLVARLPWGHVTKLLEAVKDPEHRLWYAGQSLDQGWSRNVLSHQISTRLHERQGRAQTNFATTLPAPQSDLAQALIKDPYTFDFLSMGKDMSERELEKGLLDQLKALFLELGKGFAFVGSQYHLEVGGQDYYLDLLFYHLRLRCFVVVELKIEDFKPEFAGKMNFYLSAVDDQLRHENDAPSIGIILCQGKNAVVVEYALRDSARPMGVAEYRISEALPEALRGELPSADELQRDFPMLSLVALRIEMERALRARLPEDDRPLGVSSALERLIAAGRAPAPQPEFRSAIGALNRAAHGMDVTPEQADEAVRVVTAYIQALEAYDDGRTVD